ncbi:MAG: hypothetical protein ACOYY3_02050 [Chloroflexota bacterium]
MSELFGLLNRSDLDRAFVNQIGQNVIYDAIQQVLDNHSEDLRAAYSIFVQEETELRVERFKLPGGGYMQRRGGLAQSAASKRAGSWDVAYPIEDFGSQLAGDDITLAYMSLKELDTHLDDIILKDINTVRREILIAMFNNTDYPFEEDDLPDITVKPLANNDGTIYPPTAGQEDSAEDSHYLVSGYAPDAISDDNDPFEVVRDELVEHFGGRSATGEDVAVFFNDAHTKKVEALSDFTEIDDVHIRRGDYADSVVNAPTGLPGRVIGRVDGVWAVEWSWLPPDYFVGSHLAVAKPLKMRVVWLPLAS